MTVQRKNIAVINCGSSSVKLDVFTLPSEDNPLSATVERVGKPGTRLTVTFNEKESRELEAPEPRAAVRSVLDVMADKGVTVDAVGHRVVHGGARFTDSTIIDDDVIAAIRGCVPLAPLHNPANLAGIEEARRALPRLPHVAVFDTAFHQTLTPEAYLYAIPRKFHDEDGVRRYGFHGTSHKYVAERAAAFFGRPLQTLRLVTLHLGNGCSACAVDGGRSVDTSMGMTPLEGLVMGTRAGDLDPAVVLRLARTLGLDEAERVLNHDSGLAGLSSPSPKHSHDMRDLLAAAEAGDADCDLAVRVFCRRVKKTIGAYAAVLGGLDAVVFCGGIGENAARVRAEVISGLNAIGAIVDDRKNKRADRGERDIASLDSRVRILVIPTDEERAIAHDTARLALR